MTADPFRRVRRLCSGCKRTMTTFVKVRRPMCQPCRRARIAATLPDTLGICACGCGQPTKIATETRPDRGQVVGLPMRFLYTHNSRSTRNPVRRP